VLAQARQHGLFTVEQAKAAGYSRAEIASAVRSGRWVRVRRTVFTTREVASQAAEGGEAAHLRAAIADWLCLSPARTAALSHESAALMHGVKLLEPIARHRPSLTMPPASPSATVSSHVHRASL